MTPKKVANKVLSTLDSTAAELEKLGKDGVLDPRLASKLVSELDSFADRFQISAFGPEAFKNHQAKVLRKDSDEKYMDTFDNPQKVIQSDSDEPYMHHTGPTFHGKGVPTYDSDDTSQVSDRPEYDVRDASPLSDGTKKQPTWPKGSSGKSTKVGTAAPVATPPEKQWAK